MNNRGFTVVELLASFVLSMIIVIIMFQLIINLKDLYQISVLKSELMNKQNIMTNKIYSDLTEKQVVVIHECGDYCIDFGFSDGSSKTFRADLNNNYLAYDNYVIKVSDTSYFGNGIISTDGYGDNMVLSINIPIYNRLFKNENFGINIVYPYSDNNISNWFVSETEGNTNDGLIVYLDAFNNTGNGHSDSVTEWVDLSGNGNNATLYNNPSWKDKSLVFNGVDNYAIINNTANKEFTNGLTLEIRTKILSFVDVNQVGDVEPFGNWQGAGGGFGFTGEGQFRSNLYVKNGYVYLDSDGGYNLNQFYNLSVTYDNSIMNFYIDGELVKTMYVGDEVSVKSSVAAFALGGNPKEDGMDWFSNVEIQSVKIYDRALSSLEIQKNYQTDLTNYGTSSSLEYIKSGMYAYLDALNNTGNGHSNSATEWVDLSGNGNSAVLYNNPSWDSNSLTFDGESNYARIENSANKVFSNGLTWQVRVKVLSIGEGMVQTEFFGNWQVGGGGFSLTNDYKLFNNLYVDNTYNHLYYFLNPSDAFSNYYTLTVVFDNYVQKYFVNGNLVGTNSYAGPILLKESVAPLTLGGNPRGNGMDNYSNVQFQNVLIYDRPLSDLEVLNNYNVDVSAYR